SGENEYPVDGMRPGIFSHHDTGMLGDIVISPQVATGHALGGGHSTSGEITLLVTHGILHLLGYDHHGDDEKHQMFSAQNQLLEEFLGYTPPQLTDSG